MLSQAKYLTLAGLLEYALQLVLPIYLVRALSPDDFAAYRFLALVLGTASVVLSLGVPNSLTYFLPRHAPREQAAFVAQTLAFALAMGLVAVGLLVLAVSLLPGAGALALLPPSHAAVYVLLGVYFAALPLDNLPIASGDIRGQAVANAVSAVVRVAAVAVGAWVGTIEAVCWAMVVFAAARCVMLWGYAARGLPMGLHAGLAWPRLRDQLGYALPFGLSNAFYALRGQAEQWIAAGLLSPAEYASVSIAAVLTPLVLMLRVSVSRSIVPTLNRLAHEGRHDEMLALNERANLAATSMLVPLIAGVFAFADVIVAVIYTERYAAAADVMRVICIGLLAYCVEFSSVNRCFRIGRRIALFDGALLLLSVGVSITLTRWIGLQGVVVGSAVGLWFGGAFGAWLTGSQLSRPLARLQAWRPVGGYLLAGCAAALFTLELRPALQVSHVAVIALGAAALAFVAIYAGVLRLCGQPLMLGREAAGEAAARPVRGTPDPRTAVPPTTIM